MMRKIYLVIVLSFVMVISAGCVAAADTKAPTVIKSDPYNGQKNVELNKTIKITFNEYVKKGGNCWVELKASNGNKVAVTTNTNGKILTIAHTAKLAANTKYNLIIHTGAVADIAGNQFSVKSFYFTTRPYKYASHTLTKYKWDINNYYKNNYVGITLGPSYVNGYVYGKNIATGKYEYAPVYAQKVKTTALKSSVIINKVYITSIGWPSGKYYYNTYYSPNNKWIAPGKYKGFWKFTVYYKVRY